MYSIHGPQLCIMLRVTAFSACTSIQFRVQAGLGASQEGPRTSSANMMEVLRNVIEKLHYRHVQHVTHKKFCSDSCALSAAQSLRYTFVQTFAHGRRG